VSKSVVETRSCRSAEWLRRAVNPSRELRRFESFTCHPVPREAVTCGNASHSLLFYGGVVSQVLLRAVSGCTPVTCGNVSDRPELRQIRDKVGALPRLAGELTGR
jgi:hypothetical protein